VRLDPWSDCWCGGGLPVAGGVPGAVGAGDAVPLGEAPLIQDDTNVSITNFFSVSCCSTLV